MAAGRSLPPNTFARRARYSNPPNVPMAAPITPTAAHPTEAPLEAPNTAPQASARQSRNELHGYFSTWGLRQLIRHELYDHENAENSHCPDASHERGPCVRKVGGFGVCEPADCCRCNESP